ncbi:MAG TPA: UDP-3-O-(3-hydroxymyristoyl)glucosamine N-acyltransferase [Gemmatimonadales bacterium]|nr:UDP-3-O-(3-hydroxymyristoyl)glucosamine N-acyltransferase [Gemmatimonadales bacterium]
MPPRAWLTAGQVAQLVGGEVRGGADVMLGALAPLDRAGPGDLSFLVSSRHARSLAGSRAGAVLVTPALATTAASHLTHIVVADPRRALGLLMPIFHPEPEPVWGIGRAVKVGRGSTWRGRVALADHVVLGAGVRLGRDCVLDSGAHLGDDVVTGDRCHIGSHAILEAGTRLGHRVRVAPGAHLGGAGFAYAASQDGHDRIPHAGRCRIEDDVDIGAHTVVDRGTLGETTVGRGTKIDSLVKVAHNVRIGARCLIMAQVGIAGSAVVEDDAVLAGQAGLADHTCVGRGAQIGAQSGVIGRVPAGATVSGYPARDHRSVLRQAAALGRLTPLVSHLEALTASHGVHER